MACNSVLFCFVHHKKYTVINVEFFFMPILISAYIQFMMNFTIIVFETAICTPHCGGSFILTGFCHVLNGAGLGYDEMQSFILLVYNMQSYFEKRLYFLQRKPV
jgi:hypothetical protein